MIHPLRWQRWFTRSAFFALFVLAPPLDIFRLDLYQGNFIFFGHNWTLGLEPFQRGEIDAMQATFNLLSYGFLPLAAFLGIAFILIWHYGRIYCGWLCPHFSVVESVNHLMRRAIGKHSLWERKPLPEQQADGSILKTDKRYWLPTAIAILGFAFLWAVSLLTYLLPPDVIYQNLLNGELTRNQALFIGVATLVFSLEFLLARHLFCRYGCAVGLFQSLIWIANPKAMVVTFDKSRGDACKTCVQACDHACPMRLNPRKNKRHMFTCTQCSQCIQACDQVMKGETGLLQWKDGTTATQKEKNGVHIIHFK
jgi:polyferredoxin